MEALVLFPENEQLRLAVEKLRAELSMLMLERDELLFGRIAEKELRGTWLKLDIKIYLQE